MKSDDVITRHRSGTVEKKLFKFKVGTKEKIALYLKFLLDSLPSDFLCTFYFLARVNLGRFYRFSSFDYK